MEKLNLEEALEVAVKAAIEAGEFSLNQYGKAKEVRPGKVEIESVIEIEIKRKLLDRFPSHRVIGEEEGSIGDEKSPFVWYVDPIDGTRNFVRGIPRYCVSIALARDDRVIVGTVYNPNPTNKDEELFSATCDTPARLSKGEKGSQQIHVSTVDRLSDADLYYTLDPIRLQAPACYDRIVNQLASAVGHGHRLLHTVTCTSYEMCLVADGRAEGILKLARHSWGFAAAGLIVEKAGGRVTDENGAAWSVKTERLVVSNGRIHDELTPYLRGG